LNIDDTVYGRKSGGHHLRSIVHPIIYDGVFTSKPVVVDLGISEALTVGIQFEHLAEEGTEVTPIFMGT